MFLYSIYINPPQVNVQHQLLLADVRIVQSKLTPRATNRSVSQGREISDDSQLHSLKRQLFNQINPIWRGRSNLKQDLVYRVAVGSNGDIIAYQPLNQIARSQVAKTPLPNFLPKSSAISSINQTFASFRVVFRQSGALEISPWWGFRKTPDVTGSKITQPRTLIRLQRQLQSSLRQYWNGKTTSKQDLKYRVAVNKNGIIADYEPINQVAYDHYRETPLPMMFQELHGSNVAPGSDKEPLAHFRVVFKRNGSLEITPWRVYQIR